MAITDEKINPIEQALDSVRHDNPEVSKELFEVTDENFDLKTDVIYPEDVYISTLKFNDEALKDAGLKPVHEEYLKNLLRVRVSLDRQSRSEFVGVNSSPKSSFSNNFGEFDNIKESRK